jgi:hypothetical protein
MENPIMNFLVIAELKNNKLTIAISTSWSDLKPTNKIERSKYAIEIEKTIIACFRVVFTPPFNAELILLFDKVRAEHFIP